MPQGNGRRGLTLLETLVVLAIIGVLLALTTVGVQRVRASAARTRCQNHLRQIGLGLSNHHAAHGRLPPGVTLTRGPGTFDWMGWGVRLLPFIEQDAVWRQATEAAKLVPSDFTAPPHPFTTVIPVYGCPSDGRVGQTVLARGRLPVALGSYLGVAGTRHARRDGCLFGDSGVKYADITDGTSHTLLVGERPPSPDMWTGWWYGGVGVDWTGTADMVLGVRERATPPAYPALPDCGPGFTKFQPGGFDNPCDVMHYWSPHPGGAHFLFADGGVRFLRYEAADVLPALATRAGGEVVALPD